MSHPETQVVFSPAQLDDLVRSLAEAVAAFNKDGQDLVLVGIRTGGAYLALRMAGLIASLAGSKPPTGVIDITLYRDDWTRLHNKPQVGSTDISFPIEDRTVVLVDDVLFTGRTVRAALDALIDFGRPRRIELAVLIDRGGRELPIHPDYVGAVVDCGADEVIDVYLTEEGAAKDEVVRRPRLVPVETSLL
ncbi:MAG: bifunctional pyr operon transcriptional regulator/uracil phosphoribosyltransferase PyrR [Desulfarculaceae bacterium]|jgi:pyrimidine operon attenuation protein/uracil phosphoribosyltransferase